MTDADVESKLRELANLVVTLVGAGVEDAALATCGEAMAIIREHNGSPRWELLFLLQLLNFQDESLFPEDCRRYRKQILDLAIEHVDAFSIDPALSMLGNVLDSSFDKLDAEDRNELGPRFEEVSAAYSRKSRQDVRLEPSVADELPPEILEKYAILARLHYGLESDIPPFAEPSDLHDDLCDLIDRTDLTPSTRHIVLSEIHYLTMRAGARLGKPNAAITGASALFDEPRYSSELADQTDALRIMLATLGSFQGAAPIDATETLAKVSDFIWNSLRMIYRNNIIRFVAVGLARVYPLLAAYVDHLLAAQDLESKAMDLIFAFQGALTTVTLNLLDAEHPADERWAEFIIDELDGLLRGQAVGSSADDVNNESGLSSDLERGQYADSISLTELPSPPRGYEERNFILEEVHEETPNIAPPTIDSVRGSLDRQTALVYIFASRQNIYGGHVTPHSEPAIRRLCDFNQFERRSLELTKWLHRGNERFLVEPDDFRWIHELIMSPLLADLPDSVRSIVFHAPQVRLPLHLAYDGDRFLLDNYAVTYSHSADARWQSSPDLLDAGSEALLFDGSHALHFAAGELDSIAAALEAQFHVTRYAHRRQVVAAPSQARVIHYAGHMSSRLGDRRWSLQLEDSEVTPSELLGCVGRQTQLVSLFSCYSADQIGTTPTPIGISTLLRGVGVQNVVGCLWPIPDEIASRIATWLYRGCMEDSLSIAESLRRAMLQERSWPPGVWGSVVCYGHPGSTL